MLRLENLQPKDLRHIGNYPEKAEALLAVGRKIKEECSDVKHDHEQYRLLRHEMWQFITMFTHVTIIDLHSAFRNLLKTSPPSSKVESSSNSNAGGGGDVKSISTVNSGRHQHHANSHCVR